MPELSFNWEEVVLIVTIAAFFLRIDWQLKDFKRTNNEFLAGIKQLAKEIEIGFKNIHDEARKNSEENTQQHRSLIKLMQDRGKESDELLRNEVEDVHSHLRQDLKDHNAAHKALEEKVSKTLNLYEAQR